MCEFSEARQCEKVILGVGATAAGFFVYFFDLQQKSMKNKHQIHCKMSGTMTSFFFLQNYLKTKRKTVEQKLSFPLDWTNYWTSSEDKTTRYRKGIDI